MVRRIGIGFDSGISVKEAVGYAKLAEEQGFHSFWMHETYFRKEAATTLACASMVTRHLIIGSGCLNIFTRNPALLAMTAGTLDEISSGRFILGLGVGGIPKMIQMGYHPTSRGGGQPLKVTSDCVNIVRALLRGETVSHEGSNVSLSAVNLGFKPPRRVIPLYLATRGKVMTKLAVNSADGVILSGIGDTVQEISDSVNYLTSLASGKSRNIEIASYMMCSVSNNATFARKEARRSEFLIESIARIRSPRYLIEYGIKEGVVETIKNAYARGDFKSASDAISDDILDSVIICGTPVDCARRFEDYCK
ncbi:MAG: LLM class flavin-dependent oxidoreductase, partial [Thaumarchaeota archaeon]|nr:LLM class flavin-dependent oxidoreductase [Nitrososphaerota archaeon]